ncbi:DUF4136 domain-containing protein [Psychromonas algicola]|uniref:DUF4136 domain-containing protein n=1 Tax=Psychromonas algicola TaxID=2555642 RepID=UPI0010678248|nr:DUF4136 domain-containing protein [Psychromonas sp. RZ5]TEW44748.1 DUF4136 domain-containing protein [Psychromonas sp. RZ5]
MKKITLILTMIGFQLLLLGCTAKPSEVKSSQVEELNQPLMIISSGKPSTLLPAFTTYTWSSQYNRILFGPVKSDEKELQTYIRSELISYLNSKGYVYQKNAQQADVIIGFVFALEDDVANQKLQNKFGLLPGVIRSRSNQPRYNKGTFILGVLDRESDKTYWRSAVQGFTGFENDVANKETSRLPIILKMMLDDFPRAGR